jgi:hypothetical protein
LAVAVAVAVRMTTLEPVEVPEVKQKLVAP